MRQILDTVLDYSYSLLRTVLQASDTLTDTTVYISCS